MLNIIMDICKSFYYEICSYFVPKVMKYKIVGECKKCGRCCNYMYSFDTYTEKEFKFVQFLFPSYKRFYVKGKDEYGNLIFACKYVLPNGLCSVYDKRLKVCKNYPMKYIYTYAQMHEGCGYSVEKNDFKSILKKVGKK